MWAHTTRLLICVPAIAVCAAAILVSSILLKHAPLAENLGSHVDFILKGGLPAQDRIAAINQATEKTGSDRFCHADILRSIAIVQIQQLQLAGSSADDAARKDLPQTVDRTDAGVRDALACSPTDGFLWYALGWIRHIYGDPLDVTLGFMRMSYKTSPREAWIATRRNAFMVTQLDNLPNDMADTVLSEYGSLVENGFYHEALAILTGPGWVHRERLVATLSNVKSPRLSLFVRLLKTRNVGIDIPGTSSAEKRPWD